jgi:hypothetical protein
MNDPDKVHFFGNYKVCLLSLISSKFLPIYALVSLMAKQIFLAHRGGGQV